jgi:hypothetical protein
MSVTPVVAGLEPERDGVVVEVPGLGAPGRDEASMGQESDSREAGAALAAGRRGACEPRAVDRGRSQVR